VTPSLRSPGTPDRILVVRTDRLGDLLMNVPLVRRLRLNFPKSFIAVLCREENAGILKRQPDLDEVIGAPEAAIGTFAGKLALLRRLRRYRFDCVVVSNPTKYGHALSWALGARVRAGFARKWGFFLNRPTAPAAAGAGHEIDRNLHLVDALCPQPWDGVLDLGFKGHPDRARILERLGLDAGDPPVCVHAGTSDARKAWAPERFRGLVGAILERTPFPVAVVGTERPAGGLPEAGGRLRDLTGRTSLEELAVVLGSSRCLVSLDSGPYHVAWMQGVPVVGLFMEGAGGSHPARWGAYPGLATERAIFKPPSQITEEEVFRSVHEAALA
jgi:ADP-heptose:LPS heptosyltransferase